MTNETYVECLVAKKANPLLKFLKMLLIMLAVAFFLLGFMTQVGLLGLIIAVVFAVLAYLVHNQTDIEYEYLYLDKEITIDKISAKTKRKRVATYEVDRMEVFAPINSYRIDNYKNRQTKDIDYSSGVVKQPECRYVMYYEGNVKLILEPSQNFVKALYNVAPRKVYKD